MDTHQGPEGTTAAAARTRSQDYESIFVGDIALTVEALAELCGG